MTTIDATRVLAPLPDSWRYGIAVGRAYELLRADVQAHLAQIQREIGFRYCRFHGLFHDDMQVVVRAEDGELRFQWGHVGKVLDYLRSVGLKPFVELNPMPRALASGDQTFFYWRMNVTPPRRWEEWEALVESFARWAVRRYGIDEVRTWWFEVWNEPNLDAFWSGTWPEYLELFRASARALRRVDPRLCVGGPASAEGGSVPEFIAEVGNQADFVSTHLYPMNEFASFSSRSESPYPHGSYVVSRLRSLRDQVGDRPLFLTEWNALDAPDQESVDWMDNPTIDGIGSAAVTTRLAVEGAPLLDGMFWWVASDVFEEAGMPQSPFSGTYGMLTFDGLPKPSAHAFRFLAQVSGERVAVDGEFPPGTGAIACRHGDTVRVLLWNHVPAGVEGSYWSTEISIVGGPREAMCVSAQVCPGQGSAYEAWREMGSPQDPTPIQMDRLRAAAVPQFGVCRSRPEEVPYGVRLGPNEIALLEWAPRSSPTVTKSMLSEQADHWNAALAAVPPVA